MKSRRIVYIIVNLVVIALAAALFIFQYRNIKELFAGETILAAVILLATVVLVHAIKAVRLYIALYGSGITFLGCLKTYFKVTPVSVIIPFKLGEFFRMYCYGTQIGNMLKGVVIILLDRFMDTVGLLIAIALVCIFTMSHLSTLAYLLIIFVVFILLVYFVFPGVYRFWKKYLMHGRASEKKLAALRVLEAMNKVYCEMEGVAKGRGMILFFMSLIAWAVEIGSIALMIKIAGNGKLYDTINNYLNAAMGGKSFPQLQQFVAVSVVVLIASYLVAKAISVFRKK